MDVILSGGRELTVDLNRMTIREWRELFDPATPEEASDAAIARVCGLTEAEIAGLGQVDYRRIIAAVIRKGREPVDPL